MQYLYVIVGLVAVLGVVSVALAFTSMQLQSLVFEAEKFKEKVMEANNKLKEENEQLKRQILVLMTIMQSDSSVKSPVLGDAQEVPMVTIAKGKVSGIVEQKNLVIRTSKEFEQLWEEIYSGTPSKPQVQQIDFASATVLAVFNGERPNACHDISIRDVEVLFDEHGVAEKVVAEKVAIVIRTEPSTDTVCEEVPTRAYHLVAIPFSLGEITFDVQVENVN